MKRNAFKMQLKAGYAAEYKKRHDEIWPELVEVLENAGISDYSIHLDPETNILFATQKIDESQFKDVAETEVVQKWWKMMADIMETNPDNSPITKELQEVFHMD